MSIKKSFSENKKEFWEAIIKEWKISGLSKTLFCKQRSIAESSFGKWYRRLKENFKKNNPEVAFVPITIKKEKSESGSPLLLVLKDNIKITIPKDTDAPTLKMLLEMLGVLPC